MPCRRRYFAMRKLEAFRSLADQQAHGCRKFQRDIVEKLANVHLADSTGRVTDVRKRITQPLDGFGVVMSEIDGKNNTTRYDRRRVRQDGKHADREAHGILRVPHCILQGLDNRDRAHEWVPAISASRSACVTLFTLYFDTEGALSLNARHHTDGELLVLERDTLLDMRFDEAGGLEAKRAPRQFFFGSKNLGQRFLNAYSGLVSDLCDFVEAANAGKNSGAHHSRREA